MVGLLIFFAVLGVALNTFGQVWQKVNGGGGWLRTLGNLILVGVLCVIVYALTQ